ncbi:MAG: TerB family tellurite resistance protein [Gammaproteobacteria bacterium]|jgi:uncharacterized tellurite resistance protein B-like protein
MFSSIQELLTKTLRAQQQESLDREQALRMATVALLMEVARADYGISDGEREVILRIVERYYSVSTRQALEIADAAERHAHDMTSLHPLTRLITRECSVEERVAIVRLLWEVTFADGHVDKHEEHLVRKVADLLYVPHKQFIRTRLQESGE